jgi:hypothetical protein
VDLYDFPHVPDQVAGKWPWQKKRQKRFDLLMENKSLFYLLIINPSQ